MKRFGTGVSTGVVLGLCLVGFAAPVLASQPDSQAAPSGRWDWHVQSTYTVMENDRFRSPYAGPNSLIATAVPKETFDATLYVGYKPWSGAEIWGNLEADQGFGLSNTLGLAGYASGEAYKVGAKRPYLRLQRLFLRQTINLGNDSAPVERDLNQFASAQSQDRLVLTAGKFGVPDIFDTSVSAHDPRHDFLNWSVIDTGSFDYAADAWGYSMGAAAELYEGSMTFRAGLFDMSDVPNSTRLDNFSQMQGIAEIEKRYSLAGQNGAVRLTGFVSRARMAAFSQILALTPPGTVPDPVAYRHYRSRSGLAMSLDQSVSKNLSLFGRIGGSDGHFETYEFTDIDQTAALGLSLKGEGWHRGDDAVGLAVVSNAISSEHAAYLAAGGLGPLIGDGQLPHPRHEHILETYYSLALRPGLAVSIDYQYVRNPAYNADRGPVSIAGLRIHAQY